MSSSPAWNLRVVNYCLFVDDAESGSIQLQHNARPGLRPYIHPLHGPGGLACLTEDSPWHHPWQHGVQTGFHGVNGCDFWFDPGHRSTAIIGTIDPGIPVIEMVDPPSWRISSIWRHSDQSELFLEQQIWSLQSWDGLLLLDLDWCLRAVPDVVVDQGPYGGLFVRMPFQDPKTTTIVNSALQKDDDTEQQPAAWVDLSMPVNGGTLIGGIAILDHPENPGHPAHWRVDAQRGINPAPVIPGPIELQSGQELRHRYRLILHEVPPDPQKIQKLWLIFAG